MKYLTAKEVAARYNIGLSTVYELSQKGELPRPERFGAALRWPLSRLEAADAARAAQAVAA